MISNIVIIQWRGSIEIANAVILDPALLVLAENPRAADIGQYGFNPDDECYSERQIQSDSSSM